MLKWETGNYTLRMTQFLIPYSLFPQPNSYFTLNLYQRLYT